MEIFFNIIIYNNKNKNIIKGKLEFIISIQEKIKLFKSYLNPSTSLSYQDYNLIQEVH